MNCIYCKKRCQRGSTGVYPQYNTWYCHRCLEGCIFYTEKRDDLVRVIQMDVKYRDQSFYVILDHDKQTTVIREPLAIDPLANFNYVAKLNPSNIKAKMKTMLTFS